MPIIDIEGLGKVQFPDSMNQADIERAIKNEILPMVAQRVPSAMVASLAPPAGDANPFTKGTVKVDPHYKVGDRYRYRVLDALTKVETRESRGGMITEVTDTEVIYGNGRVTDLLGNLVKDPRGPHLRRQPGVRRRIQRRPQMDDRIPRHARGRQRRRMVARHESCRAREHHSPRRHFRRLQGRRAWVHARQRPSHPDVNYWIAPEQLRPFIAYETLVHAQRQSLRQDGAHGAYRLPAAWLRRSGNAPVSTENRAHPRRREVSISDRSRFSFPPRSRRR